MLRLAHQAREITRGRLPPMEKWGGAECTVNRVGDGYFDQIQTTGHHDRANDMALLASLGLDALRFPILWERVAPQEDSAPDWEWTDRRLDALQAHKIRPIAGLLHHGSGPAHTSLIDDRFAEKLAGYASQVVQRYPSITDWTPVNEPLTTARFSALYGLWYPHARDERLFWAALLNQIDATRLAMRAIRKVQPKARLIQTEDLGRTYATRGLTAQAAFDNERRWLTWDLLCGLVGPEHPLWTRACDFGFSERLREIRADPCPPDILGIDHYLSSDRLLDERMENYPVETRGKNLTEVFCDLEAVRVLTPPPQGLGGAIREAWARYHLPIAITEVHNGCTREEQVRWFTEAWSTAQTARDDGIDVRAVTAWALFGSSGWNKLLTAEGDYEPGAFDVSSGDARETALTQAVRRPEASVAGVAGTGWWRRDIRLHYPPTPRPAPMAQHLQQSPVPDRAPVLITGATGTLGQAFAAECRHRDIVYVLTDRSRLDLSDPTGIVTCLEQVKPWAVINAAGWVRVDDAEDDPEGCFAANTTGAVNLSRACAERGIPSLNFSSDLVFDGAWAQPYRETDRPSPQGVYGSSKADMEGGIAALDGNHLIVRTAAFFSEIDSHNFAIKCIEALTARKNFEAASDSVVSPTYVPHLCRNALDLLLDGATGIWHLTNGEGVSWYGFARKLAAAAGLDEKLMVDCGRSALGLGTPRPRQTALHSTRGTHMPSLDRAIARFAANLSAQKAG